MIGCSDCHNEISSSDSLQSIVITLDVCCGKNLKRSELYIMYLIGGTKIMFLGVLIGFLHIAVAKRVGRFCSMTNEFIC